MRAGVDTSVKGLLDAMPHLVWVCRADGPAEFFNAQWYAYTGLDVQASQGDGWLAAIHPEDIPALQSTWSLALTERSIWEYTYRLRRHDGVYRHFEARATLSPIVSDGELYWVGTSTDVETAHQALAHARGLEQRFRAVIEHAPEGFVLHDIDGRILEINETACTMFGLGREELLHHSVLEFGAASQGDLQDPTKMRALWASMTPGTPQTLMTVHRHSDGREIASEVRLTCYDHEGSRFYLALGRDVTARLAAEASIRQTAALLDLAPAIVFDLAGRVQFWSKHTETFTGYGRGDALGRTIIELVDPQTAWPYADMLKQLRGEGFWEGEVGITDRAGQHHTILSQWTWYRDAASGVERVLNIYLDITAQKRAEQLAQAAETDLLEALQRGGGGTWRWDVERDRVSSDRATGLLLGAEGSDGQHVAQSLEGTLNAVHVDERNRVREALQEVLREGEDLRLIVRTVPNPNVPKWVSIRGRPTRDASGLINAVSGIVTDVSVQVAAQQALTESREVLRHYSQSLNAAIENERLHLARELHDELGQRLTALKLDLHWLDIWTKQQARIDNDVVERLHSMDGIIDTTIKDTRAMSAALRPIGLEQLGLQPALEGFCRDFSRRTGIRCSVHLDAGVRVPDAHKLPIFRIFQEAMTNVARHSRATQVEILLGAPDGHFRLEIHDNGIGTRSDWAQRATLGIVGMRERAFALGGNLLIKDEQGTSVVFEADSWGSSACA